MEGVAVSVRAVELKRQGWANALALKAAGWRETRQLGEELTRRALLWVHRWGWTSPSVIDYICLDGGRRGKAAALVRRGLLARRPCTVGTPDAPRYLLTLTDAGRDELWRLQPEIWDISAEIRYQQIRHDYIVQCIVAQEYKAGRKYRSGPELAQRAKAGHKIPDAIIENIAIELELTPKKPRELSAFVSGAQKICNEIDGIKIFSTSKTILETYKKLWKPGTIAKYMRGANRTWFQSGRIPIYKLPNLELIRITDTVPNFKTRSLAESIIKTAYYDFVPRFAADEKAITQKAYEQNDDDEYADE